jgi:transposase
LYESYQLYQNLLTAIKLKDQHRFWNVIHAAPDNVSDYMKTSLKTAKKYQDYFTNAIQYNYSNGVLEGLNNKIKVLKRIAFGYKNFYHFKNRILITQNLVKLKTA